MFSVVIPLYNKELSVKNTIDSVLNQTFENFEVIIVNDGSTDNSLAVVQQFTDPRIRIIVKENGGVSSARNRGIKEAIFEWVCFLDGDDLWLPSHLVEYKKVIADNPQLNWVISGYTSMDAFESYLFVYKNKGVLKNIFDDLLHGLKIHTSTVCVKKMNFRNYDELFFREGINNSEDREVWYKLCCLDQSPFYIDKSLSVYYIDIQNSLTNINLNENNNYLSLLSRLEKSNIYKNTCIPNQVKLKQFIYRFNSRAIKANYIRNNYLHNDYKDHMSFFRWGIYRFTMKFPKSLKFLITKLC